LKSKIIVLMFYLGLIYLWGMNLPHALCQPRGPLLVLATPQGFGTYLGEILRAEGFNDFQMESPGEMNLTANYLRNFDIVLLAQSPLTGGQSEQLSQYVKGGGNLVAFRPDQRLARVFGIVAAREELPEGYIKIDTANEPGKGLLPEPLRFHGESLRFRLNGAAAVASLYSHPEEPAGAAAVTWHIWGKGIGVAFSYNLPQSIVLTRQGNPLHAGLEKDGIPGIRAADMFTSGWVDPAGNGLNQADEQMHLLSRIMESLCSHKKPLPRFWYFPGESKSLVMLTDDGEDSPEADLDAHLADVKNRGGRMTLYLKGDYIPPGTVKRWVEDGFEISGHVDDTREAVQPTYAGMDSATRDTVEAFQRSYGLPMQSVRNHWIVWCGNTASSAADFAAQARIEASHGIRFDCNLYHYDQESSRGHFLGPAGSFTGSGLPMRFSSRDGDILNIYGSVTQLPDEQWGPGNMFSNFKLLLDRSVEQEIYSFINLNFHTERWKRWSKPEGLAIIDYAHSRQVPIRTVAQVLRFVEDRAASHCANMRWNDSHLSFQLEVPPTAPDVTLMLPMAHGKQTLQEILWDHANKSWTVQTVRGIQTAFMGGTAGSHQIVARYGKGRPGGTQK